MVDRVGRHRAAERGIGAVVTREDRLDRRDRAVAPQADARGVDLVAVTGGREEVLAPRLDPLHGAAQPPSQRRDQHFLGVDVALDAEAAANVGRDHADRGLGEIQRGGRSRCAR